MISWWNFFFLSLQGLDEDYKTDRDEAKSEIESEFSQSDEDEYRHFNEDSEPVETPYVENEHEELGLVIKITSSFRNKAFLIDKNTHLFKRN